MAVTKYYLLSALSVAELAQKVNDAITTGSQPFGQPFSNSHNSGNAFYQSMIDGVPDGGGGGSVSVDNITDAGATGKSVLKAADIVAALTAIGALGNSGDQVLDGKLTLNNDLILKQAVQTDANVIEFYFGPDDGTVDVAIRATATTDNKGQLAFCVRDDSGNLINTITIDGNSKQIMFYPDYKVLVGNSNVDISGITAFAKTLIECTTAAAARTLLGAGTPYTLPAATTTVIGGVKQTAAQANSTATDVAGIVADFNAYLAKQRTSGQLAP